MKGGVGAADHAISVYGGINDQQRAAPHDNLIAVRQQAGGRRGGSTGVDLGSSIVLLGLNELGKRRRTKVKTGGKSKKNRTKRRSSKK
jgi:hypothetical protein